MSTHDQVNSSLIKKYFGQKSTFGWLCNSVLQKRGHANRAIYWGKLNINWIKNKEVKHERIAQDSHKMTTFNVQNKYEYKKNHMVWRYKNNK